MTRGLLNSMPDWALFLVVVGLVVALALLGLYAVRRWVPHWRVNAEISAAVGAMVMTLFALVLAFAAVNLYDSYRTASGNVEDEANSLAQIARDVRVFPGAGEMSVDRAMVAYIREVRSVEFPAMHDGTIDPRANSLIDGIFTSIQALDPKTPTQVAFYDSAVARLGDMVAERRSRISVADSSLPTSLLALLLLTAALSIGITLFLRVDVVALEVLLVGAVAAVVGAGLLTILLLEFPFSGSVAVSSDPFTHGVLSSLLARYP
jgi:hypothetical protein